MGKWAKNRVIESGSKSVVVPAGTTTQRPDSPVFGQFRFNIDSAKLEFFNGIQFLPLGSAGPVSYTVDTFTADGSTSVFTMNVQESDSTQLIVFVGSIYQDPTSAYTVNGGYDITFTSPPPAGEPVSVIHSAVL